MKIAIIGVGSVRSTVATAVQNTGLAHEIVLFDRDGIRARAAAEDCAGDHSDERNLCTARNESCCHNCHTTVTLVFNRT